MTEEQNTTVEEITEGAAPDVSQNESAAMSYDEGVIKVNLGELNKTEDAPISVKPTVEPEIKTEEPSVIKLEETVVEQEPIQAPDSLIEEITDEVIEKTEVLTEQIEQAIVEQDLGVELPENIQKVVDFINDTNGTLEDYVKLNQDYSKLNEGQLLREYYEHTKPHLEREDIDFLMEDNFQYDEDIDEERDVRRKKLAKREELAKAKNHLDGLKSKYYDEIKGGSKLAPEQQKAVEFFNRYNEENKEATKIAESQTSTFKQKTETLFSDDFKGFDFNVGEKKFRFKVNNVDQVKDSQGDINNFVKKFLNNKNEMSDATGYHKSLFAAMNPDQIANHFYEQGKADAIKSSVKKSKNIDMSPRGAHENVAASNGWSVKSISGGHNSSKLRIKK
jgi:hypothetical protein